MMADRLALATRERLAIKTGECDGCRMPIAVGQAVVRVVSPSGWCHVRCVPVVAGRDGARANRSLYRSGQP
jgi:hypothetical protein